MRPSVYQWAMEIANVTATRATCQRAKVGCVLLDAKGRVLATGYNGAPAGLPNCIATPCPGTSIDGVNSCIAIHAEANALIQCTRPDDVDTVVVTHFPCFRCTKMLLNTGMKTLVHGGFYSAELYTLSYDLLNQKGVAIHAFNDVR